MEIIFLIKFFFYSTKSFTFFFLRFPFFSPFFANAPPSTHKTSSSSLQLHCQTNAQGYNGKKRQRVEKEQQMEKLSFILILLQT